ncbi:DUF5990 family protein [Brevundimonas sp. Bb-A]|uniref:DUF5990 family protein n=1 Tax=Brevundimonas sp. Bb-A TaxID=2560058 RepID=UPI001D14E975|nr:DUF5990 family protein [Brevundimonas sp. Bb-A]
MARIEPAPTAPSPSSAWCAAATSSITGTDHAQRHHPAADHSRPGPRRRLQPAGQDQRAGRPRIADDGPISFDVLVTLSDDGRLTGPFVRREGPSRRFIYIAIGTSAGQHGEWIRRAKIDVHDIPAALLAQARAGQTLEVILPGRARDGGPACATVRPLQPWTAV